MAETADAKVYDVIIIGGGPTGLTAAMYAGREGMSALVLEAKIIGGMAAITERIDNYPGFRNGIGGIELSEEMYEQALRFGAQIEVGIQVEKVEHHDGLFSVVTSDTVYASKSVIMATGSTYRKMQVPGEEELIGRGIHFCATCDAPFYKDRDVVVVGGGNSAVQESSFISRFAKNVTVLVRSGEFHASDVLVKELESKPNVTVHYNSPISRVLSADNKVTGIASTDSSGQEILHTSDGIFVFIGLIPSGTDVAAFALDQNGFIITDATFMTSIPGVFACGDIRSGSTWQIASAVGEGAATILSLREYLRGL